MHLSHPQEKEKEAFITTPSPSSSTSTATSSLSLFHTADSEPEDDFPSPYAKPGASFSATSGTMMSALSPVSVQSPSSVFMMKEAGNQPMPSHDSAKHTPNNTTSVAPKSDDPFDVANYPTDFDSAFLNLSPTMGMDQGDGMDGIPLFNAEEESAFSSFLDNVALDPNFIFEPNLSDALPKWPESKPWASDTHKPRSDKFTKFGNSPGLDLLAANSPDAVNIHERLLKHESKEYLSPNHSDYAQSDSRAQALAMAETQGYGLKHKESRSSLSQPSLHANSVTGSSVTTTRPSPQTSGPSPVSSGTSAASSAPMGLHFGSDPAFGGSGFQPSNGTPALKKVRGFDDVPPAVHEGHGHMHMQPQRMVTGLEGVVNPKLVVAAAQMSHGVTDQNIFMLKRRKSDNMAAGMSSNAPHDIYAPVPHAEQMYHMQQQNSQQQSSQQHLQGHHPQHHHPQHQMHQLHHQPHNAPHAQHFQARMHFGDGMDGEVSMSTVSEGGMHMNPNPSMLFPDKEALADSYSAQQQQQQQHMHHSQHNPPPHHPQHNQPQPQVKTEQNLSASPTPGSPNLTEDQKRMNHISSEKRRRDLIKQEFEEMCGLVPRLAANSDEKGKRRHGHRGRMPKDSDKDKDTGTKSKSILLSIVYDYMCELVERNKTMRGMISEKGGYHSDIANALHPPKIDE
ncbi:BHLH transcription factor Yas2p [Yarrowia sp. B02]|nr:BHLH transcription factor Yas2p [Yarrowia sp. B02]